MTTTTETEPRSQPIDCDVRDQSIVTQFRNPWHRRGRPEQGPEIYETEVTPIKYRGHLIFERVPNSFDVVADGVALSQRAGISGAKRFIDERIKRCKITSAE